MRKAVLQDFIVPICLAEILAGSAKLIRLEGTAFFINGEGFFLTAGHVISGIQKKGAEHNIQCGLNVKDHGNAAKNLFAPLLGTELAPHPFDVGIGKVDFTSRSQFSVYSGERIEGWKDVATLGYPQSALNPDMDKFNIHLRLLKGYIQRPINADELPAHKSHPDCFELSFAITNGLSGSPLFVARGGDQELIGVCVYSYDSEVVVDQFVEIQDGGAEYKERRTRVEQYGIAHSLLALMSWKPALLDGRTLQEAIVPNNVE